MMEGRGASISQEPQSKDHHCDPEEGRKVQPIKSGGRWDYVTRKSMNRSEVVLGTLGD